MHSRSIRIARERQALGHWNRGYLCHLSYACSRHRLSFLPFCIWNKFGWLARIGYVCSIGLACSYDRSRIKHGDIFRGIFALAKSKSDKPARIFLLLFSLFWKLRAYVERIRHFINEVIGTSFPAFLLPSSTPTRFSPFRFSIHSLSTLPRCLQLFS